MAKRIQLGYKEIESRLEKLKQGNVASEEIGYHLLYAFGKSEKEISRYKEGKGILKTFDGLLIKGLFCYQTAETVNLTSELEQLKNDQQVIKAAPKIICVSDGKTILAFDRREKDTYENPVNRVYCDFAFFYPLMDVERIHNVEEAEADVKAAEKLAKLHDELRAYNEFSTDSDLHDLNIFISRLLFCFFAEDTGIFEPNLFSNSVKQFTKSDGSDLNDYLQDAFHIMDVPDKDRGDDIVNIVRQFPYVNGGLFAIDIQIPRMSAKARRIIIECGDLDWQDINPDIFGSMIQAVVNPDVRANQGMHYTSVPNIMKVINPLFLDDLRGEYNLIKDDLQRIKQQRDLGGISNTDYYKQCTPLTKRCNSLLLRMSKMKFFDPACGSGNFLIITYKALRLLEMDVLTVINECSQEITAQFIDGSCISIGQFYGIELLDFPHEIAMLSLWLAEHQMNKKLHDNFGVNTQALPLQNITQIVCGNACRVDWNEVCPHTKEEEVFVFGNPPYLGARLQDDSQKEDMAFVFSGINGSNNLDYIACWFLKGADYIDSTRSQVAFVSTNSISQGEQVCILWPHIFNKAQVKYAYSSFKWTNNAKYNAGVTCTIIGMCGNERATKCALYHGDKREEVEHINAYLMKGSNTIVSPKKKVMVEGIPEIQFGSMPNDGGFLLLSRWEKDNMIEKDRNSEHFIHRFYGSEEFINDGEKYCLWIEDDELQEANEIKDITDRIENCRRMRAESKRGATNKLAKTPHRFGEVRHKFTEKIIMPAVSSERRPYIPIGYLDADDVISNSAFAIYDAPLWLFGILTSRIHMDWVRAVGGRLETRYRYSAGLCYNTFPFPKISESKKKEIEEVATDVLLAREGYPGNTLAELYDPDKMPDDLREAHEKLDRIVESCYQKEPFTSDEQRLECLFKMYEKMTKDKK